MTLHTKLFSLLLFIGAIFTSCDDEDIVPLPEGELVAIAGPDRTIRQTEQLDLDASATKNINEKPFSVNWSIKTKPQGSNASITSPASIHATFQPDFAGKYVIKLTVTQGEKTSSDELTVTVRQAEPQGPQTIILDQDITTNRVLEDVFNDAAAFDYLVTANIAVRAALTVRPGVVIAFAGDKGLEIVTGSIQAKGTTEKPITFRGIENSASFWKGILVHTSSDLNEFEHATISGAGSSPFAESGVRANLAAAGSAISGAAVKISHTSFTKGGGYGFYLQGMSTLGGFSSNNFSGNTYAAFISANQLHKIDNDALSGSTGLTEVETGGSVIANAAVTWKQFSYVVTTDVFISADVTVEPGATFKMKSGATINVRDNGSLKAIGTASARITFTSVNPGAYWNGIYFNTYNENNKLVYSDISKAGFNKIADAEFAGNVVFGHSGIAVIEHSVIRDGLGYGVVLKNNSQVNSDVTTVNTFLGLQKGPIYPEVQQSPELPPLTGVWLDEWSFRQELSDLQPNFYNKSTGIWFEGAGNPWATDSEKGMGIRFHDNGTFTWLIAESSPWTGCESYSAEYITGTTTVETNVLTFNQEYWRSKFVNACDPTQNVDMEVDPSPIQLAYEIEKMYNVITGEGYWVLTFTNPDGSKFALYRRLENI